MRSTMTCWGAAGCPIDRHAGKGVDVVLRQRFRDRWALRTPEFMNLSPKGRAYELGLLQPCLATLRTREGEA